MSLNRPEVEKIAHLARLEITEDEMQGFVKNLSRIIDFVDQLQSVDTSGVVPMAHALHMVQRLRADLVTEPNEREKYQANASKVEAGLYLVPRVIEKIASLVRSTRPHISVYIRSKGPGTAFADDMRVGGSRCQPTCFHAHQNCYRTICTARTERSQQ